MKIQRNDCVDCTGAGLTCLGDMCPYHDNYEVHICDKCKQDIEDEPYITDGKELCAECAEEREDNEDEI